MQRWARTAASLGVLGTLVFVAPAHAADAVVVRGTDFPLGSGLAHVGCSQIYDAGAAPVQPYVAQGPDTAPRGARSLGFDLPGGDAAGPVRYTASMAATTTASLSVLAPQGSTGVAWAGYQEPGQEGSGRVWFGRAPLTVPAGGWTSVEVSGLTYDWAEYDTGTGRLVTAGPQQSVADFAAGHGQTGAGLWAIAFGCDGKPFNVDALRFGDAAGTTTYDLEGLATQLTILGSSSKVVAGDSVRIDGTLSATGAVLPHATAILERRNADTDGWEIVRVVDADGGLTAVVVPPSRTAYRWRFVDRPLAEGSTSPTFVVEVARAVKARVSGGSVVGSAAPGRAGLAVTLRRADRPGSAVRATTGVGGAFRLPLDDVGSGRYVVSVAAASGNLTGASTPLRVVGDAPPAGPAPSPGPPTRTPSPTPSPSASPSAKDTSKPSNQPTPSPTPTPRDSGTPAPGPSPSAEQTPSASTEPTPSPESSAPSASGSARAEP